MRVCATFWAAISRACSESWFWFTPVCVWVKRPVTGSVVDAIAPVAGAASTLLFDVPPGALVLYLGFFAGFLLYIGAADILPEAHSQAGPGTALGLIGLTSLGAALMLVVARLSA